MPTSEQAVVQKMFAAFKAQDLEEAVGTVSADTVWVHHGTQKLPSLRFVGKPGVRQFFEISFSTMQVEYFRPLTFVQEGSTVVVTGEERFTMPGSEDGLAQKWVQIYTVREGLITRMEEFATSAAERDYQVIT